EVEEATEPAPRAVRHGIVHQRHRGERPAAAGARAAVAVAAAALKEALIHLHTRDDRATRDGGREEDVARVRDAREGEVLEEPGPRKRHRIAETGDDRGAAAEDAAPAGRDAGAPGDGRGDVDRRVLPERAEEVAVGGWIPLARGGAAGAG